MAELLNRRSYTRKIFDNGDGSFRYNFHIAHQHYKDGSDFKKIDTTLSWDDTNKVWHQEKASYHSDIPEYADGLFNFYNGYEGANHFIKATPVASHVKGELTNGANDGNYVLYRDAFGKGIDLKVYAYHGGLKKVIIINEKPQDTKNALTFDFELILPKREETVGSVTSMKEASVIDAKTSAVWSKAEALDFKSKNLQIGFDGKFSYFRDAMVWDSGMLRQSVDISLFVQDGKTFIRKTITPEILEKAVYPLMTDHPTSYYAGAGDGTIDGEDATWSTIHNATAGASAYPTADVKYILTGKYSGNYNIRRGFFPVDTSGIDDGATITDAVMKVYIDSTLTGDNDGDDWVNVIGQTSQAATNTLGTGDFDQCGAIDNPTEGATRIDISGISAGYSSWTLNATGIGWINKTGVSLFGIREGHDCINSAYAGSDDNWSGILARFSEDTAGTKDPYLDVTVSAGTTVVPLRMLMGVGV